MRRLILASVASALAFSVIGVASASSASAATNGSSTHFTATYPYLPGSTATCVGNRIVNNGGGTKDVETCMISGDVTGFVAGTYKSDPSLGPGTGGCAGAAVGFIPFINQLLNLPPQDITCWFSDYDGAFAQQWTETFSDNGTSPDTWTLSIVAYYNS